MEAIRRGWYLGKENFRDKLLNLLEKAAPRSASGTRRVAGAERDRGEKEALRILREGCRTLGLPLNVSGLADLRKAEPRKVQLAILLRTHTTKDLLQFAANPDVKELVPIAKTCIKKVR